MIKTVEELLKLMEKQEVIIQFNKLIYENDYDGVDEGFIAKITSVRKEYNSNVYRIEFDMSDYLENNYEKAKPNYYDKDGKATLKWQDTNYYPKDNIDTLYLLETEELPFVIINGSSLFIEYTKEKNDNKTNLEYVEWLEEMILNMRKEK